MAKKKPKKKIDLMDKDRKSKRVKWMTVREVEVFAKGGYFDSEGVLHNENGCPRCTSVVASTGKRCKNFAVPGELHCQIHGGVYARAKGGKQRLYSAFIEDAGLKNLYNNVVDNPEIQGIREELGLLRVLLANIVKDGIDDAKELKSISSTIGEIRKLVDSCVTGELRLGQLIDIDKVVTVVKKLAEIVKKHVKDEEIIKKIAYEFDRVVWPAPLASTPQPARRTPSREISGSTGSISD